jgi:hypothetical protein
MVSDRGRQTTTIAHDPPARAAAPRATLHPVPSGDDDGPERRLAILARVVRFVAATPADVRAFAAEEPEDEGGGPDLAAINRGELVPVRADAGFEVEQDGARVWWEQESYWPLLVPVGAGAAAALAQCASDADSALAGLVVDLRVNGLAATEAALAELALRYELAPGLAAALRIAGDGEGATVEPGRRERVVPTTAPPPRWA